MALVVLFIITGLIVIGVVLLTFKNSMGGYSGGGYDGTQDMLGQSGPGQAGPDLLHDESEWQKMDLMMKGFDEYDDHDR